MVSFRISLMFAAALLLGCGPTAHDGTTAPQTPADNQTAVTNPCHADESPEEHPGDSEQTGDADESHHDDHAHHHDPTGMSFEDAEFYAKHFDDPSRDEWQKPDEVIALLDVDPGQTAVDIGAGTGYFLPHLSAAVGDDGEVLGLDVSEAMVEYMTQRIADASLSNVEARQVAGDDPGLEPESVDRIIVVNTWHHIPERVDYSRKLLEGLRPGGMVMVVDYTKESEQGPAKKHKLEAQTVIDELTEAGFEAELLDESLPEQYIVVGRAP